VPPFEPSSPHDDHSLLDGMRALAESVGQLLLSNFSPDARPQDRAALAAALNLNEALVDTPLREGLSALRPGAAWLEREHEAGSPPDGEWWVVDAVEGNVNHVHGLRDWGVTLTLIRDGEPVIAVVHQPLERRTWTARKGGGARCNDQVMRVSAKAGLDAAIATTGQAEAGQTQTYGFIGASVTAMLGHALLVRASVPSTFLMLQLAGGQSEVFWQYACVLSGVAAGLLIVQEAGGVVTRIDGRPWRPGATDILATAPSLHAQAVAVLGAVPIKEAA
jgi:myo-inositol-1(or 4)-monophosphatase